MCGIIGFIGTGDGVRNTLDGLVSLEYRGYDSAGIAYIEGSNNTCTIRTIKSVGHVEKLQHKVATSQTPKTVTSCIGHTRWATHGKVNELNAHPHTSTKKIFAVVHNGIIENFEELRDFLRTKNIKLCTETDTEVIPNLIEYHYEKTQNFLKAVSNALSHLRGSYAIAVLSAHNPNTLIVAKHGMPLSIAKCDDAIFVSSDTPTALSKSSTVYILGNDELALTNGKTIDFFIAGNPTKKEPIITNNNRDKITKLGYSTFMEKEINDIPQVFEKIIAHYTANPISKVLCEKMRTASTVHIIGCGTAYHAGLTLGAMLEEHAKIRTKNHIASEFRYNAPLISDSDVGIVISQSGETADTISAMQILKERAIPIIALCNTDNSTIARECNFYLPTCAGFEIAVASTKAYCAQVLLSAILCNEIYKYQCGKTLLTRTDFAKLPIQTQSVVAQSARVATLASAHKDAKRIFFLGKHYDCYTSLESALKVKEITYMHCEGYASGELKHGTLSLVDEDTLSVIYQTSTKLYEKTANGTAEVRARGSKLLTIATDDVASLANLDKDTTIVLPSSPLSFCYSIIPAQLFALYLARLKNLNPDKPRNLAKSVTVE